MNANLNKFQAILATKDKRETENLEIRVGNMSIKSTNQVVQLEVILDIKLSYDVYISDLLRKASAK